MKNLPSSAKPYKRTPEFTELSTPKALLRRHSTKPGTWGEIIVLQGSLGYRILEPETKEFRLDSNHPGIIEPAIAHEVEPHTGVRFYVQFYSEAVT